MDKQEPVVFYECNGCQHQYIDHPPSSCDCFVGNGFTKIEYYTAPPKAAEWVGLTDEEVEDEWRLLEAIYLEEVDPEGYWGRCNFEFAKAIEAKLKEKNESA